VTDGQINLKFSREGLFQHSEQNHSSPSTDVGVDCSQLTARRFTNLHTRREFLKIRSSKPEIRSIVLVGQCQKILENFFKLAKY